MMECSAVAADRYEKRMPPGYDSSVQSILEATPSCDAQLNFMESVDYEPRFMWRFMDEDNKLYTSIKPITVKLNREGKFFFAENENLGICGTGFSSQEATDDLGFHIIYFFKYYRELNEDQLMDDALRLKHLYADLLIEEQNGS